MYHMDAIEKEARRLVSQLLIENGYFSQARFISEGKEWEKLPGLVALVESLLKQDKFVPPADPDEVAVRDLMAGTPGYWEESISLELAKNCGQFRFTAVC
jgi:hypothetical protein